MPIIRAVRDLWNQSPVFLAAALAPIVFGLTFALLWWIIDDGAQPAARVGAVVEVLADSTSRRRATELAGRTSGNTVVNFRASGNLLGRLVDVRITDSGPFILRGDLADRRTARRSSPTARGRAPAAELPGAAG